jgi:peroxiredoxin
MKRLIAIALLSASFTLPAQAALNAGDSAPDFKAPAAVAGSATSFNLKEALQKGPVVVYFYPAAYTSGCNIQAHTFAENYDKFTAAGATIVGVSLDSIARLKRFSADPDYCAGKLTVASDVDGRIAKAYELNVHAAMAGIKDSQGEAIDHGFAERTTFIVTPDGKIAATIGGISPASNVEKALAVVQQLAAGKSAGK